MRWTGLEVILPFNCGTSTCSCGEDKGDGGFNVKGERESMVGDFKEGMKRLANVLRNGDGEFVKTAVANQEPPLLPLPNQRYALLTS